MSTLLIRCTSLPTSANCVGVGPGSSHAVEELSRQAACLLTGHFLFVVSAADDDASSGGGTGGDRGRTGGAAVGGNGSSGGGVFSIVVTGVGGVGGIDDRGGLLLSMLLVVLVRSRCIAGKILSQPSRHQYGTERVHVNPEGGSRHVCVAGVIILWTDR